MCGIPGSGKSYKAKLLSADRLDKNCKVFSSDEYRLKLLGDEKDQSNNQLVFSTLYKDLVNHLQCGYDAILDATNISIKDRRVVFDKIEKIRSNIEVVAYLMNTPLSICIEQDNNRDRTVGKDVLLKMIGRFQCPQYFEGFDKIIFEHFNRCSTVDKYKNTINSLLNRMYDFNQKNPHHVGTLGQHCVKLANNYDTHSVQYNAGILHDIGKLYTQSFDELGIAHYYNHDNIGAYEVCCNTQYLHPDNTFEDCLTTISIINFHMKFHKDWLHNAKYRNLLGEDLYNMLVEFANNDKLASGTTAIHSYLMKAVKCDKLTLELIQNSEEYRDAQKQFNENSGRQ